MTDSVPKRSGLNSLFQPRAKGVLLVSLALLIIAVVAVPWPLQPSAPTTRRFTMVSRQFEFEPNTIQVNQGDTVIITLTADDVVHGFFLDGYGVKMRVEPGQSQTVQFVADKSGKFRYRCSVSCGTMHPFMLGELVVGPNTTFGRAVALIGVVAIGVTVYLWKFPLREPGESTTEVRSKK